MRAARFGRVALSVSVAATLLSACGGASMPHASAFAPGESRATKSGKTFTYTGSVQTFVVPSGVSQITVVARGGEGAGFVAYPSTDAPGRPGRVYAIVPVTPGEKLYVFVGASGSDGGFNGGGNSGATDSGSGSYSGNPGGGASDVRAGGTGILDRIIVAAGGGGAGQSNYTYGVDAGGNGGGLAGKKGGGGGASGQNGGGGGGGTQRKGGAGGAGGSNYSNKGDSGGGGTLGLGGNGGSSHCSNAGVGGGGGGGYYGGGGGGAASIFYCDYPSQGGGGGGGSSYVEPSAIKSRMWTGWKAKGDGLVVFTWNS
jgi:hypothetical protein